MHFSMLLVETVAEGPANYSIDKLSPTTTLSFKEANLTVIC